MIDFAIASVRYGEIDAEYHRHIARCSISSKKATPHDFEYHNHGNLTVQES